MQSVFASCSSSAACSGLTTASSTSRSLASQPAIVGRPLRLGHSLAPRQTRSSSSRQLALAPRAFQIKQRKWWEETKNVPANVRHINSVQELVNALGEAGDSLVVVDYFASWCSACKALYPKLCKLMAEHPEATLLCVNFDENKGLVKSLNVKVLPFLQFYRGAHGKVAQFSAGASKIKLIEDAIARYSGEICVLASSEELPPLLEFPTVVPKPRKPGSSSNSSAAALAEPAAA